MADDPQPTGPSCWRDAQHPIEPNAVIVEGAMQNGHACRLIDNTASVEREALEKLLAALIREGRFRSGGLSPAGGNVITIGAPQYGHVQLGEHLYRLLVFPYEARIERF